MPQTVVMAPLQSGPGRANGYQISDRGRVSAENRGGIRECEQVQAKSWVSR